MRVLHVHDIAHIPQLLLKELKKKGIDAYFSETVDEKTIKDYDIIHAHYALNKRTIDAFKMARMNHVPFILHCHGSDLRLLTGTRRVKLPIHYRMVSKHLRKHSTKILLSTPDLVEFEPTGEYIPNPVNLELFMPMPYIKKSSQHLICGKQIRGSKILKFIKPEIQYDCVNNGEKIQWPENVHMRDYVPYEKFPEFLNQYEHMLGTFGDLISMARLEAMACGVHTFTDFEKSFTKYYDGQNPDEAAEPREFIKRFHSPEIIADRLIEIYDGIKFP